MTYSEIEKKIKEKEDLLTANVKDIISKKNIKYNIVNKVTMSRVETLFTKEPITIKWIRTFEKNKIFFDIGANVGMYSIFAAIVSNVKVYAFEPEANNFQVLMSNIFVNNLNNVIMPYPIGISDKTELTALHLGKFNAGSSHHTVGNIALNHSSLDEIKSSYKQGIFSTTLDELYSKWDLPLPSYIKIDVDGIENKIMEKAVNLIKKPEIKSILIEINENRSQDISIIKSLEKIGFKYDNTQVNSARRNSGSHKGYAEYLFYK